MEQKIQKLSKDFIDFLLNLFKINNLNSYLAVQDQDKNQSHLAYLFYSKAEAHLNRISESQEIKAKILAQTIFDLKPTRPLLAQELYIYLAASQYYEDPKQIQFEDLLEMELLKLEEIQKPINKIYFSNNSQNRE